MKSEKIYLKASLLYDKMYDFSLNLNEEERKKLYREYFSLIQKAAYAGNVEAQFEFGQQFENIGYLGMDNPQYNPKRSFYWYSKACNKDHAEACNNLAYLYETGNGCKKNLRRALNLYKRSAELGYNIGKKNYKLMLRQMAPGGLYNKGGQRKGRL